MKRVSHIVPIAVAFEGALGLAGVGLCTWFAIPLEARLAVTGSSLARAAVATLPTLVMLACLMRSRWRPLAELRQQVETLVGELFRDASLAGLAIVAVAAGVGEELLFRGALQPLAARWVGPTAGVAAVSLLFGAAHALSWTYFLLAAAIGGYLGWLEYRFDDLLTPMFVHAAYDFAALVVVQRRALGGEREA